MATNFLGPPLQLVTPLCAVNGSPQTPSVNSFYGLFKLPIMRVVGGVVLRVGLGELLGFISMGPSRVGDPSREPVRTCIEGGLRGFHRPPCPHRTV